MATLQYVQPTEEQYYGDETKAIPVSMTVEKVRMIKEIFKKIEDRLEPVIQQSAPEKTVERPMPNTPLLRELEQAIEYGQDILKRITV